MKLIKEGEVLVAKTRTGADKFWQGLIYEKNGYCYLATRYWQITKTGKQSKIQESEPYIVKPKNLGKTNETTTREQADLEFKSMVLKQMDKGYNLEGALPDTNKLPLPMLAQKWKTSKHRINFPAYVQPKLDGNRVVFNGDKAQTRGGKPIIPEVMAHLQCDTQGMILDGELMLPDNQLLQDTNSAIKKFHPETSPLLEYHVYDIVDPVLTFKERYEKVAQWIKHGNNVPKNIKLVSTFVVESPQDVSEHHVKFTNQKYEGTIIRNLGGSYQTGQRSPDLQKFKDMEDDEFEIVDVISGEGLYEGCGIFVCKTPAGEIFNCNPEGTIEQKRQYLLDRENLISKMLTVRYQTITKDGKPQFPVGVIVRDYE